MSKLQTVRNLSIVVGWIVYSSAASAGDGDVARFNLGKATFCVPRVLLVEEAPGWIPKDLPQDGFVFFVPGDRLPKLFPQRDRLGRPQEFTAYVASTKTPGIYALRKALVKRAKAPGATLKEIPNLKLGFSYESHRRDHWVAWKLPEGVPLSVEALERVGMPIATCSRPSGSVENPQWKGSEASCRRVIQFDGLRLGYAMDANNLDRFEWLDQRIKDIVSGWRCAV